MSERWDLVLRTGRQLVSGVVGTVVAENQYPRGMSKVSRKSTTIVVTCDCRTGFDMVHEILRLRSFEV